MDLIRVYPLADMRNKGFTVGQTTLKMTKHEKPCMKNQYVFISFTFDTFGFLTPEAV